MSCCDTFNNFVYYNKMNDTCYGKEYHEEGECRNCKVRGSCYRIFSKMCIDRSLVNNYKMPKIDNKKRNRYKK